MMQYKSTARKRAQSRKWNAEHKPRRAANQRRYYKRHQEVQTKNAREKRRANRLAAIAHYGGKCACCGEERYEFLAIDHAEGGGTQHKKKEGIGCLATWVMQHNFPKGFRILCHNCNSALGYYGYCPHENDEKAREEFWGSSMTRSRR